MKPNPNEPVSGRRITYLAKLVSNRFRSIDRGHNIPDIEFGTTQYASRHRIWNDPVWLSMASHTVSVSILYLSTQNLLKVKLR